MTKTWNAATCRAATAPSRSLSRRNPWCRVSRGDRDLRRREPRREPRKRILILSEGERTEPGYFRALRRVFRNHLVDVEIDDRTGVPKTLVELAVERKKQAKRAAK